MAESLCEIVGDVQKSTRSADKDGGTFFQVRVVIDINLPLRKEGSSLCQKETKHGFTSNTSLYQVYATSVAVWTMMTRTVIFGWIAKGH